MSPWSPGQWQGPNKNQGISCLSLWAMCHLGRIEVLATVCSRATGDRARCWAGTALERADCPPSSSLPLTVAPEV